MLEGKFLCDGWGMIAEYISTLVPLQSTAIWLYKQFRGHICHRLYYGLFFLLWITCQKAKQEHYVLQVASSHSSKPTISHLASAVMTRCVSRSSSFQVWECVLALSHVLQIWLFKFTCFFLLIRYGGGETKGYATSFC